MNTKHQSYCHRGTGKHQGRICLSRISGLILTLALAVIFLSGCAHKTAKTALQAAPPYDPAALQAKSLELARQLKLRQPTKSTDDYEIGPTDVLEISVFEVPKYLTLARVGGDGTIRFPDLGIVKVGGLSERQAEDLIQKMLKDQELVGKPQVTVFVKELHAKEITITGEVRSPGVYPIRGNESLIDLISKAGGLSGAAGSYAYILRDETLVNQAQPQPKEETVANADAKAKADRVALQPPVQASPGADAASDNSKLKIDLVGLLMRGESQWNIPLQARDRVTIPPVGWVHVTGRGVEKAGTYQLRSAPNMLRQSIDDAGGLIFAADYNFVIIRRNPDGRQETFTIDYKTVLDDEHNDITLQGGDTIIVNRTMIKTALSAIGTAAEKVFRFSVGGYIPLFGSTYGGGY